ncbi:MAG: mechanosensitive ion channel, partial [Phycisphaerales bacterium]|nr:mechanosensitive ion channel [Phycisphaerales bacterium]
METCAPARRTGVVASILAAIVLLTAAVPARLCAAQDSQGAPSLGGQSLGEIAVDELKLRLAPLSVEELAGVRAIAMDAMRRVAGELSETLIARLRAARDPETTPESIALIDERIQSLQARKSELMSRVNAVLAALESNGQDVAADRAYLSAIDALHLDEAPAGSGESAPEPETPTPDDDAPAAETARTRVAELVAIVRAEPPVHERPEPWTVPVAELELELQPLAVGDILARLDKWQEILQREVRKRIRIDILLSDANKLEAAREQGRAAALAAGLPELDVPLDQIKALLAEQSQAQQQVINAIVARMEVLIRLVERRGGDADQYADYIAAATGQKLNLTDLTVLRAQLEAWLTSEDGGIAIGLAILKFLVVVVAFWILSKILGNLTFAAVKRMPKASTLLRPVLARTVRRVTFLIGLVIGVSMLGVNTGPLLAMIGAAGLVIGLALQGTLSNFASGILILMNRPFDVGDVIDAGGVFGKVEAMNLVSTKILTFDNQLMIVPNNQVWNGVIKNVTGKNTRRVDLTFGIGYADNASRAMEIIAEVIGAHPKVLSEPAPAIRINELGDNSVNIIARPWSKTSEYWDVYWDVMEAVKARFDKEGINIPFPQRDLH